MEVGAVAVTAALRIPAAHVLGGAEGALYRGDRAARRLGQARAQSDGRRAGLGPSHPEDETRCPRLRSMPTACRRADSNSPSIRLGAFCRRAFPRSPRMLEGGHQRRARYCRSRCSERSCRPAALNSSGSGSSAACPPCRARSPYWLPQTLPLAARNTHLMRSERREPCSQEGTNARLAEQPPGPGHSHLAEGVPCPARCHPSSLAAPLRASMSRSERRSCHVWRLPELPCIEIFHRTSRRKRSPLLCRRRGREAARPIGKRPKQGCKASAWKLHSMKPRA